MAVCLAFALSACATLGSGPVCPAGLKPATTAELVFGRNIGDSLAVSDEDWRGFLDTEITPRFPNGLTIIDASGQWRSAGGAVVQEPAKVLFLVLTGAPEEQGAIEAVRLAYRTKFHQESVLLIERPACAGF